MRRYVGVGSGSVGSGSGAAGNPSLVSDLILALVLVVLAGLGAEGVRAFARRQLQTVPADRGAAAAVEPVGA